MLSTKPGRFSAKISRLPRLGLLGSSHSLQQGGQWVLSGVGILGGARGIGRFSEAGLFECCFTSTETVGLLGTGAQDGYLDFHTIPEL